ncbi:MAG: hypothetical protein U0528_17715 [Anaerolineae bacterium]
MKLLLVAAVVFALGALAINSAYAQGPGGNGNGMGMGGYNNSLIAVAAKALGMDQTALVAELTATEGKTIADVAKEKGVALESIVDAFVAPHAAQLQAAVTSGRLTQEQADAALAQMKANVTTRLNTPYNSSAWGNLGPCTDDELCCGGTGMGFGMGMGMGMMRHNDEGYGRHRR